MRGKSHFLFFSMKASLCLFTLPAHAQAIVTTGELLPATQSSAASTMQAVTQGRIQESILTQIESNELALYSLYNELNSSDEYDINCATHTDENYQRPIQICEPVFFEKVREGNRAQIEEGSMHDVGFFGKVRETLFGPWVLTDEEIRARAEESIKHVQQELEVLSSNSPALRAKLEAIGELQQEYFELAEQTKSRDPAFMWQNEPGYRNAQLQGRPTESEKLWFSAPPAGYTQPQIHFGYRDSPH